jgi:hypothetical protein
MARSVRIEFPGAYYHVMARSNRRPLQSTSSINNQPSTINFIRGKGRGERAAVIYDSLLEHQHGRSKLSHLEGALTAYRGRG